MTVETGTGLLDHGFGDRHLATVAVNDGGVVQCGRLRTLLAAFVQ